jgi:prepilin peptidase CpaA
MLELTVLLLFPAVMAFCAASDVVSMTIPNRASIALTLAFPVVAFAAGMPPAAIGWQLLFGAIVLAVTFGLFAIGVFGGGDAKMLSVAALWLGFEQLPALLVLITLAGGLLTIALLNARAYPWPGLALRLPFVARLTNAKEGVPYGVAIAAGALILFPHSAVWQAAFAVA